MLSLKYLKITKLTNSEQSLITGGKKYSKHLDTGSTYDVYDCGAGTYSDST